MPRRPRRASVDVRIRGRAGAPKPGTDSRGAAGPDGPADTCGPRNGRGATSIVEEVDALVIAARAVVRGARLVEPERGELMAIPERPTLWDLVTVLDKLRARELREQREAEEGRAAGAAA